MTSTLSTGSVISSKRPCISVICVSSNPFALKISCEQTPGGRSSGEDLIPPVQAEVQSAEHRLQTPVNQRDLSLVKTIRLEDLRFGSTSAWFSHRCRANTAHTRQSRPDYGLRFRVKVLKRFQVFPSPLSSGLGQ